MNRFIVAALLLIFPVVAHAETTFTLSPKAVYYAYHERVMDETGYLKGVNAEVEHITADNYYAGLEAELLGGSLRYDGQYSNGVKLSCNTNDLLFQSTASVGKRFTFSSWNVTPYTGIKYRYWQDDIIAQGGYLRRIHQFYLPIGVNTERKLQDGWSVKLKAEGSVLLYGEVHSDLSDVSSAYSDAKNNQIFGNGVGARIATSFHKEFEGFGFGITPYFEWYEVKVSQKDTIRYNNRLAKVIEPHNTTWMLGLSCNLSF